jgi:hypothetical protein
MRSRRPPPLLLAALLGLTACSSAREQVALAIDPAAPSVAAGETIRLHATVVGADDEPVVWSVVEEGGGTIDETGRYTAPALEGTFHVTAFVGNPDTARTVEIRVLADGAAPLASLGPVR